MRIIIDGMSLPENDTTHIIVYADGTAIKIDVDEMTKDVAIAREENDG